jgi:hypothetical protein
MLLAEEGMQAYYTQLNSLHQDETRWNLDGEPRPYTG